MFSNLRQRWASEDGVIVNVFMLAACVLFVAAVAAGFALGKYAQAMQMSQRCASMVAKSTMVYMQRQAPPDKGVLTTEAKNEGIYIFNRGFCNSTFSGNPLMSGTANITFQSIGSDVVVVTVSQYVKGYGLARFLPWKTNTTAAAYTYQYGGAGKSPIYDGPPSP